MNNHTMDNIEFEDDIVSVEESMGVEVDRVEESLLTKAGRAVFYVLCALFPLWFLPTTINPVELNKAFFISIGTLITLMLAIGGMLQEGRIRLVRSRVFWIVCFLVVAWLLSALFSESVALSFWGFGSETTSFIHIFVASVLLFLVPIIVRSERHLRIASGFLVISLAGAFLFFLVQSVFRIDIFSWTFAQERSFHPFGSWNALALFFGFGSAFLLPFFGAREKWRRLYYPVFFLSLVGLFFTNFAIAWGILATIALLFVALTSSRREQHSALFAASLLVLLVSILFVLLNNSLGRYFQTFSGFGRPQEVVPSYSNTIDGVKRSLSESPLLGRGPNTFSLLWEEIRPASINATIFWQTRFDSGFNTILTIIAEVGIAGLVALLALLSMFLWHGIRAIGFLGDSESTLVRAAFSGGFFLVAALFFYPFNFALWALLFLSIGFFFAALCELEVLPVREIRFFETRERGFLFSLVLIFLMVGGVIWTYFEATRYMGLVAYARGIGVFSSEGAVNGALEQVKSAISFDASQDRYYRTYAQLEYVKMSRALNQGDNLTQEERLTRFRDAYTEARARAETAIAIGKKDPQNYRMLGQVYELAIPFDETVSNLAIKNYEMALELSPNNPLILADLARTYLSLAEVTILRGGGTTSRKIAAEKQDKAIEYLTLATELKPDFTQAHFTLSQLYFMRNQIDEAIKRAEAAVLLAPNNLGTLFQLGFLYYQKESFDRARPVFERAVALSPNYSNARYFLGLIYDREGRANDALVQFEEIQKVNPASEEVSRVIAALKAGKKASDALGQPPPEKRKEAPLGEGGRDQVPTR